jgi:tripartite-type tricarboxylate transporter receptor subunit TctC
MKILTHGIAAGLLKLSLLLMTSSVYSQAFPNKPLRIIVPFPPGGGAESTARIVAQKMSEGLGQPVLVETRPGAGGNIGTEIVAKAQADGYTLLLATSGMTIQPHLQSTGWDPLRDFAPLGLVASYSLVIAAHPSMPFQTLPELIAYAKANPGKLTYGSSGSGGPLHLGAELFASQAGIKMLHVPYKGNAPMTLAILSGEINLVFDSPVGPLPNIRAGKLRALGTTGARRSLNLPEVPTVREWRDLNLGQFEYESWNALAAPAGTPVDVVRRLSQEVKRVTSLPEVRDRLSALGYEPRNDGADDMAKIMAYDYQRFGQVIKQVGIKLD